nr:hypothetical protein BaRGS_000640 [Batillaria attramentaria]
MAVFYRQGLRDRINVCLFSLAFCDTGFNLFHYVSRIYALFYLFDVTLAEYWEHLKCATNTLGESDGDGDDDDDDYDDGNYDDDDDNDDEDKDDDDNNCDDDDGEEDDEDDFDDKEHEEDDDGDDQDEDGNRDDDGNDDDDHDENDDDGDRRRRRWQMAVIVLSVFTVCLVGTGIGSFKYKPVPYQDPVTNLSRYRVGLTDFYLSNRRVFHSIFDVTFNATVSTVAFVVVIAATIVIAVRMRSVLAWRQETAHVGATQQTTSSTNQREAALTRMLLVVCVVFTVCATIAAVQALTRNFLPDFMFGGRYNNALFLSLTTTHFVESVNCSINFIIYYTMSTRFRETLREMVHGKDKVQATSIATISHSSVTENKL